jgi:hypothetical protein
MATETFYQYTRKGAKRFLDGIETPIAEVNRLYLAGQIKEAYHSNSTQSTVKVQGRVIATCARNPWEL